MSRYYLEMVSNINSFLHPITLGNNLSSQRLVVINTYNKINISNKSYN
jgi:hypothetical protein